MKEKHVGQNVVSRLSLGLWTLIDVHTSLLEVAINENELGFIDLH